MKRGERGANLVEFALVAPVLLILIGGIIDVGRAFHSYMIITNAAREGARAAARMSCYDGADAVSVQQRTDYVTRVYEIVREEVAGSQVNGASLAIVLTPDAASSGVCPKGGTKMTVKVDYSYLTIIGQPFGLNAFTLHSEADMTRNGSSL